MLAQLQLGAPEGFTKRTREGLGKLWLRRLAPLRARCVVSR